MGLPDGFHFSSKLFFSRHRSHRRRQIPVLNEDCTQNGRQRVGKIESHLRLHVAAENEKDRAGLGVALV